MKPISDFHCVYAEMSPFHQLSRYGAILPTEHALHHNEITNDDEGSSFNIRSDVSYGPLKWDIRYAIRITMISVNLSIRLYNFLVLTDTPPN